MRRWALALGFVLLGGAAWAHDVGCGGKAVPPDIKASCCGKADAHLLTPDDIEEEKGGFVVTQEGEKHLFRTDETLPSNDGCYWVWWRRYTAGCSYEPGVGVSGSCGDKDAKPNPITWYCLLAPFSI